MNVLIVGSNGFLGRAVIDALRRQKCLNVYGTHRHRAAFPNSLPYDFWHDDLTPLLEATGADTVILIAAVEPGAQGQQLQVRAEQFFRACGERYVVYLSSDAIFDGTRGNYRESDVPSPITPYGRNLELLERATRAICRGACIIRPSYLYGCSLEILDHRLFGTRQRLLSGETVYYAADMFKSPMGVGLAAEAITELILRRHAGTVHISGTRTSLYTFYLDAMCALGVPTTTLHADRLPADTPIPCDTSLAAALMHRLTGVPVLSVRETFAAAKRR